MQGGIWKPEGGLPGRMKAPEAISMGEMTEAASQLLQFQGTSRPPLHYHI